MSSENVKEFGRSILHNKRVLITGGAGFIGSHLADHLTKNNCYVTALDDLSTGKLENIAHLLSSKNFSFVKASDFDEVVVDRLVAQCDVVFHLAASVGVNLIIKNPVGVIDNNIQGTHTVLKICNRYRRKVLITSTSEIYGKQQIVPFGENMDRILGPTSASRWCYSTTKAVDEFLGLAYYKMYDLPVVIVRLFNTIGTRQTGQYGMVVPRFITQVLRNEKISVYGDGNQTRCFCNVNDVVRALDTLIDADNVNGEIFNVGTTEEISINNLANLTLSLANKSYENAIEYIPYDQAYESGFEDMSRRVPDINKINDFVGWRPKIKLEETIGDILKFEREKMYNKKVVQRSSLCI